MQKISTILDKLIRQYGLEGKMNEMVLADKWEAIVGKIIADHSYPAGIRYKRLYVVVDSPVWLQEMSFYKEDIIGKVNTYFGVKITWPFLTDICRGGSCTSAGNLSHNPRQTAPGSQIPCRPQAGQQSSRQACRGGQPPSAKQDSLP